MKMSDKKPKEMGVATQLSFADDGRWHFTGQFWTTTERGADVLLDILNIIKPLLAENAALPATDVRRQSD